MGDRLGIHGAVDCSFVEHVLLIRLAEIYLQYLKTKGSAPGEARTHGLQIMRLTRCLLRYGGTSDLIVKPKILIKLLQRWSEQNSMSEGGFEPPPS